MVYECSDCGKVYNHKNDYKKHMFRKTPCSGRLYTRYYYEIVEENNKEYYACLFCDNKYVSKGNFTKHLKTKHGDVTLVCHVCHKTFSNKYNLERHLKASCGKAKVNCEDCGKQFSRKPNLTKHKKFNCKAVKIQNINNNNKYFGDNYENCKVDNSSNTNNITNKITNNVNSNNKVTLVAFGKEKMDELPLQIINGFLEKGYMAVPSAIRDIHLNKDRPEFHNVYITNQKGPYGRIYDGSRWKLEKIKDILTSIYDDKADNLMAIFKENEDSFSQKAKSKFGKYSKEAYVEEIMDEIKEKIKIMLYNENHIPGDTIKKIKEDEVLALALEDPEHLEN